MDYFECDFCKRTYTRKYNLQTHIKNFHVGSGCYCNICKQTFSSPSILVMHLNRGHNRNNQSLPECDLCGKIFMRKQNIISHMVSVHAQGSDIKCNVCHKHFSAQGNLRRHMQQMHNQEVEHFDCDECKRVFRGKDSLRMHIQNVHTQKLSVECTECGKMYSSSRNLKRHTRVAHTRKTKYFKCFYCSKVYTSNDSMQRHIRHRHKHSNALQCTTCLMNFTDVSTLKCHIKNNHSFKEFYKYCTTFPKVSIKSKKKHFKKNTATYNCEFCTYASNNIYELKSHMRLVHDKDYNLTTCNVCFANFYTKESVQEHKKICIPPPNVNHCDMCEKIFTDISSLHFHKRIFHPQCNNIADSNITSTNSEMESEKATAVYKCSYCSRAYYSDRSLKHHIKLKHTTEEAVTCPQCGKTCTNKYYLASHLRMVHCDDTWSKCDYCDKTFKSKRNIRRHIEYTHMETQRFKCIECETLFKEQRSLRKHVRTKHPDSTCFPQCHICSKRFESAKSCKIHLKIIHSLNLNTHPCHLCSVSFMSYETLQNHMQIKHLDEDNIHKCRSCNLVFKGEDNFEKHNDLYHSNEAHSTRTLPRCVLCMKDFSTRKSLKRHIRKFHLDFDPDELANYALKPKNLSSDCEKCLHMLNDEELANRIAETPGPSNSIAFNCDGCNMSYNILEYTILKHKLREVTEGKSMLILSELCTAEMSENESSDGFDQVSTTDGIVNSELLGNESSVLKSDSLSE